MVSTPEDKERRRQRMRNHIAKDLKTDKYHQRIVPSERSRKYMTEEQEGYYDDYSRYDDVPD